METDNEKIFKNLPFYLFTIFAINFLCVGSNKTYAAEPVYASNVSSQDAMNRIQLGNWHVFLKMAVKIHFLHGLKIEKLKQVKIIQ